MSTRSRPTNIGDDLAQVLDRISDRNFELAYLRNSGTFRLAERLRRSPAAGVARAGVVNQLQHRTPKCDGFQLEFVVGHGTEIKSTASGYTKVWHKLFNFENDGGSERHLVRAVDCEAVRLLFPNQ